MKLTLLCVGKPRTQYLEPAIEAYGARLKHWVSYDIVVVPASTIEQEASKLLARIQPDDRVILLDERGAEWSTPELAKQVENWQNQSVKSVVFVVGGAFGAHDSMQQRADSVWSLSRLVFPHELVRLLVSEQLYRAYDVLHGGKYHHQ